MKDNIQNLRDKLRELKLRKALGEKVDHEIKEIESKLDFFDYGCKEKAGLL